MTGILLTRSAIFAGWRNGTEPFDTGATLDIGAFIGGMVVNNAAWDASVLGRFRCVGGAFGSLGGLGLRPGFFGSLSALAAAAAAFSGSTSFFLRPGFLGTGAVVVELPDKFGAEVTEWWVGGATPENG